MSGRDLQRDLAQWGHSPLRGPPVWVLLAQGLRLWGRQGCGQAGSGAQARGDVFDSRAPPSGSHGPAPQQLCGSDLIANCPGLAPKPMLASEELVSVILVKS